MVCKGRELADYYSLSNKKDRNGCGGVIFGQAVSLIASLVVSLPCTAHSIAARENPNPFEIIIRG
jgi:hypothetical protein